MRGGKPRWGNPSINATVALTHSFVARPPYVTAAQVQACGAALTPPGARCMTNRVVARRTDAQGNVQFFRASEIGIAAGSTDWPSLVVQTEEAAPEEVEEQPKADKKAKVSAHVQHEKKPE